MGYTVERRDFLKIAGLACFSFCFPSFSKMEYDIDDSPPCGFPLSSGLEHTVVEKLYHDGGEIKGYDYYPFFKDPDLNLKLDEIDVLSTLDGVVTKIGIDWRKNPYIEVSNIRYKTKYVHVTTREGLQVGDRVIPGVALGKLSTGKRENSTGPHLHYAIWSILLGKNIENHDQFNHCIYGKMSSIRCLPK
jgi:hypothetical protein